LYVCVGRVEKDVVPERTCHEVYVPPERYEPDTPTVIRPGASVSVPLRLDWGGTPSQRAAPLVPRDMSADYEIELVMFFRQHDEWHYRVTPQRRIHVRAE